MCALSLALPRRRYHVYTALEECAEACSADPVFGPMHFPHELTRAPALAEDMAFYFGADWRRQPQCAPSAAATKYVERLRAVAATRPSLLLAHSYTRYLGDLSGGRVLMRVAVKTMQLDAASGDGVRFYVFDNVPDSRAFKKQFRASLDALPIDAELASALVDEANAAFVLNMELFRFLDEQMVTERGPKPHAHHLARHTHPAPPPCRATTLPCPRVRSLTAGARRRAGRAQHGRPGPVPFPLVGQDE